MSYPESSGSGQQLVNGRDFGVLEFYYRMISAVKQCKLLRGSRSKNLIFFEFSRVFPGDQPLGKEPEYSGNEIAIATLQNAKMFAMLEKGWGIPNDL